MATKNLGQASAIISKSTAPTNTKVIWRDTSVVPAEHKVWNGVDWFKIKIDFFTDLEDTPNSYTNQAGKILVVNQTEDGIEFAIQNEGVEEAPNDGQQYVRQSEGWAVITIPEGYDSSDFDTDFATKTTDDLTEGATNKYATGNELTDSNIEQTRSQSTTSVPSSKLLDDELTNKQDSLVSGTNIKTVGGESLLGSTNIPVGEANLDVSNGIRLVETFPSSGVFRYEFGGDFDTTTENTTFSNKHRRLKFQELFEVTEKNISNASLEIGTSSFILTAKSLSTTNQIQFIVSLNGMQASFNQAVVKDGIRLTGFGESNNAGVGADYSTLLGISLAPRKFVEDLTGLLADLDTTDKTNLVAAINEVLAGAGSGSGDLLASNNLSDVDNVATARTNLDVYSKTETIDEIKSAQGLIKRSGTNIEFDTPACYGYNPSAETTNITFDFTDAIAGMTQILRHNSGTKPTMPASANKLAGGYVLSVDNIIYLTPILLSTSPDVWEVQVTVSQDNTW